MKVQSYSYHTHTTFSDGKCSLEEMLEQAVKVGIKEFGVTDHLVINKYVRQSKKEKDCSSESTKITYAYSLEEAKKSLEKQVKYIRETAKNFPLKVLASFEIDFFDYPEWESEIKYVISDLGLDYIFTGNHHYMYEDKMRFLLSLDKHFPDKKIQKQIISNHFKTIEKAIYLGLFDFIAHIDWIRSSNLCGVDDFIDEKIAIIKALEKTNTAYEINTKGLRKIGDTYPALWMIEELCQRNVPVLISDDAHRTEEIAQDFQTVEKILKSLNYNNRFKL